MGYGPRKPVVVNLWLGNGYGRTLVIAEGEIPNVPLPFGAVEYGGKRLSEDKCVQRSTACSDARTSSSDSTSDKLWLR